MDSHSHQTASKQCTFTLLHSARCDSFKRESGSACPMSLRLSKTHLVSPLAARNRISQNCSEAISAKLLDLDSINLVLTKIQCFPKKNTIETWPPFQTRAQNDFLLPGAATSHVVSAVVTGPPKTQSGWLNVDGMTLEVFHQ